MYFIIRWYFNYIRVIILKINNIDFMYENFYLFFVLKLFFFYYLNEEVSF